MKGVENAWRRRIGAYWLFYGFPYFERYPSCYDGAMKRRIFLAIDLPADLKTEVAGLIQQWRWLPIQWQKPEHWHITVLPPIALEDEEVAALASALRASRLGGPFSVAFSNIVLAPSGGQARMVWLEGKTPESLPALREHIEDVWNADKRLPALRPEARALALHVTLARFEPGDLKELEVKTKILGAVKLKFEAADIAVMESRLFPNGAEYRTLATAAL